MFSFEDIKAEFPEFEYEPVAVKDEAGAIVPPEQLVKVARLLKEKFGFIHMCDALGHDRNVRKGRFEITWNIRNPKTFQRIFLKCRCDEKHPHVPSLCGVWAGANWHEREAYDMYGVIFDNHPDMRRLYMPEEFQYFPLRKDFPLLGIPGSIPLPRRDGADPRFKEMADRGE